MPDGVTLIVERDEGLSETIRMILTAHGHQARVSDTSIAAMEAIRERRPDLIITNTWIETREAGWDFLRDLWADPTLRHSPIIIYSTDIPLLEARAERLARHRCVALQAPFDVRDLLLAITRVMDERAHEPGVPPA